MLLRFVFTLFFLSNTALANIIETTNQDFLNLYQQELTQANTCDNQTDQRLQICSNVLRNEASGPYILQHQQKTDKVVILFHGLSDSPFYFRSIANALYDAGHNVVVALLPGHGLKNPKKDMIDSQLAARWQEHVKAVIASTQSLGHQVYLGGFSTGAALTLNYHLRHPEQPITGFLMFSGAFAINSKVEKMGKIPGIKWITKWMDRNYTADNLNPYKYPNVSKHSATMLLDIIFENRKRLKSTPLSTSIFFAHSLADTTTPISGVNHIMQTNKGTNTFFKIAADDQVCHGHLVLNSAQVQDIGVTKTMLPDAGNCQVPIANPVHEEMLEQALAFIQ